ncbi:hypothetical protein C0989_003034, partial [Termitomyces sp. Mn162]
VSPHFLPAYDIQAIRGPLLLQDTQSQDNHSDDPPNGHIYNDSTLLTIEKIEDSTADSPAVSSQQSSNSIMPPPHQKVSTHRFSSLHVLLLVHGETSSVEAMVHRSNTNQQSGDVEINSAAVLFNSSSASLSNQLNEEWVRVNALNHQLSQIQQEQVATAWHARGIYDRMSSQLQAVTSKRDSAVEELTLVAQALDMVSPTEECIELSLVASNELALSNQILLTNSLVQHAQALQASALDEHEQRYQQEFKKQLQQEHQIISTQLEVATQQQLQELERNHKQSYQSVIHCMQEEHQQETVELTRACEGLENRIQELERESQECKQRFQEELKQCLQLQQQNLATQTAAEIQQRLDEQSHIHEQSLQAQVSRLEEEHRQQIMESTVARKEMESRIQELEEVQIQAANAIKQAHTSAEAASHSETAFKSILNHNTKVISDLQEQVK